MPKVLTDFLVDDIMISLKRGETSVLFPITFRPNKLFLQGEFLMKKNLTKAIAAFTMALSLFSVTNVSASDYVRQVVYVGTNQTWSGSYNINRSGKWSNCLARCYSVYPANGGTDNFRYVQTAIFDGSTQISNTEVLDEQATISTQVFIYNGYINLSTVSFKYRGNNPNYDANCDVSRDGL